MDPIETCNRKSRLIAFIKVALVIAAIAFAAVKIYNKFFKKKDAEEIDVAEEPAEIPETEAPVSPVADGSALEVPAKAVIANPQEMETEN